MNKIVDNKEDYISINKVAYILDVSVITIKRWYRWYESPEWEKPEDLVLPQYYYLDRRLTKYFKKSDITVFRDFRAKISTKYWGIMAEFNAVYQWGKVGKKICNNKKLNYDELKGRIK